MASIKYHRHQYRQQSIANRKRKVKELIHIRYRMNDVVRSD